MEQQDLESQDNKSSEAPQILQVIHRGYWIPIAIFAGLALGAIGYLVFGRIPVSVEGNAMFLTPGTVVPFQATAGGQIARWHVKVGDYVKKGQLLVELDQPLTEKELEQAKEKLADIETRNETIASYTEVYTELEKEAIARKKKTLTNRIAVLTEQIARSKELLDQVHTRKVSYLEQHEKDLRRIKELNVKRNQEMVEKLKLTETLRKEGLRSEDQLLRVRRQLIAQENNTSSLDLQLVQLALDQARASETLLDSVNRLTEQDQQMENLEHQLQTLLSREAQLDEQHESSFYSLGMEANEIKRTIARYEKQLTEKREIRSEYEGRLLELTAGEGKLVTKGVNLGSIDTRLEAAVLEAVAYFKLKDGKKIKPGMKIRLTPATVEMERFGGLIAKVKSVSEYPVTVEGVARTVGNAGVAASLTKEAHEIEVFAELLKDDKSFSGYKWERFRGPKMEVTAGTIAAARANIKEPPPLTFVVPILRDWTGF